MTAVLFMNKTFVEESVKTLGCSWATRYSSLIHFREAVYWRGREEFKAINMHRRFKRWLKRGTKMCEVVQHLWIECVILMTYFRTSKGWILISVTLQRIAYLLISLRCFFMVLCELSSRVCRISALTAARRMLVGLPDTTCWRKAIRIETGRIRNFLAAAAAYI